MTTYKIIRFRFEGNNQVIKRGLTLDEAQAHCQDPSTSGDGWFDGYDEERYNEKSRRGVNSLSGSHGVLLR